MAVKRPSKPAPKASKAAPKKPSPPAKKAAAPAPKGKPGKPTPPAKKGPSKPAPAPKATAGKPTPPAAKASMAGGVSRKEFDEFVESVNAEIEALKGEIHQLAANSTGYGNYVSVDDDGRYVLNIDEAPENFLREWVYQFYEDDAYAELDEDGLREKLNKERSKKAFKGFQLVRELPMPEASGEGEAEAEEEDEEGGSISADTIMAMNWTQLTELVDENGGFVDYSDITKPPQPKVLRARIIEALKANSEGEEEEAEASSNGETDWSEVEEGTSIFIFAEEDWHEATFQGLDDDGDIVFCWTGQEDRMAVGTELASLPSE